MRRAALLALLLAFLSTAPARAFHIAVVAPGAAVKEVRPGRCLDYLNVLDQRGGFVLTHQFTHGYGERFGEETSGAWKYSMRWLGRRSFRLVNEGTTPLRLSVYTRGRCPGRVTSTAAYSSTKR